MRIPPVGAPAVPPASDPTPVRAPAATAAASPVAAHEYRPVNTPVAAVVSVERRHLPDRRKVCTLRQPLPWLLEFRLVGDRRRRTRRRDDRADHVDDWG